ncbi:TPA: hypothetical protein LLC67_001867 [Enterococcus faecium]|mgnify:CR=1 FL=1|uniref:Uncharacterized protein n=2 Tax=Enterococcus faecium TaxID=1352 RepID=A0A132ZI21_ENTFC|nr:MULTISPECIES: hypothetical protein [Enterococcus]HAQ1581816.1 hypothetical protein [Enterococcus faecium Efm-HS0661]AYF52790.1 hypothetical protein [Enterococcus faecium]EJX56281.1 hypothetical protein HMPREF1378_00100 [Enterococcus faecium R496]EJX88540.1 hypothetical protein HMPREF1368_00295 [Enterococcus faecium ERV69]EJX91854.1 hypothetical protein HMPREF1367_00496 [Enterococcus faecium ERV38]
MFDSIKNLVSGMTPEMKTLVQAILYLMATFFALKPGFTAMKHFGDAKWGEGLKYVGAVVAIFIIPVITTVMLLTMGTKTGNDLNQKANMISALIPVVGIYLVTKFPKEEQLG